MRTGNEAGSPPFPRKLIVWQYQGSPPGTFFSWFISGAQRLETGNTLICEGIWGRIFEVTSEGEIVWEYISPYFSENHPSYTGGNYVFRAYRQCGFTGDRRTTQPLNGTDIDAARTIVVGGYGDDNNGTTQDDP